MFSISSVSALRNFGLLFKKAVYLRALTTTIYSQLQLHEHNFWSREKYISRGIRDSFVLGEIQEAAILECDITAYESVRQREGGTN